MSLPVESLPQIRFDITEACTLGGGVYHSHERRYLWECMRALPTSAIDPLPPMASVSSWESKLVMRFAANSQAVSLTHRSTPR